MGTSIEQVKQSLEDIRTVLKAADAVIKNPTTDFKTQLEKQSTTGAKLAPIFATTGTVGLVTATGATSLTSGIATLVAGIGVPATAATVSRSLGWIIGVIVVALGGYLIQKKHQEIKKIEQEKERIINELICKQQAIINKLKEKNIHKDQEIKNLKETLFVLENFLWGIK